MTTTPISPDAILAALALGEDEDWEFKSARGGVPGSLWETVSAMANTRGGVVVLGVVQRDERFEIQGLPSPARARQQVLDLARCLLDVQVHLVVLVPVIVVPLEDRRLREPGPGDQDRPPGGQLVVDRRPPPDANLLVIVPE